MTRPAAEGDEGLVDVLDVVQESDNLMENESSQGDGMPSTNSSGGSGGFSKSDVETSAKTMVNQWALATEFRKRITCKNRLYRLRLFRNCFVGTEAVDLLVLLSDRQSRDEACALGNQLAKNEDLCPFEHVCDPEAHPNLEDAYIFYKFKRASAAGNTKRRSTKGGKKMSMQDHSMSSNNSEHSAASSASATMMRNATSEEQISFFTKRVQLKDRTHRLRTYLNCFVGSEAVDLMIRHGMAATRDEAVTLGRQWVKEHNLFEHVLRQHDFEDKYLFYRFVERRNRFPSVKTNSQPFVDAALEASIYLLEESSSSSATDDSVTKKADAPFHLSFGRSSMSSSSASTALQRAQENERRDTTTESDPSASTELGTAPTSTNSESNYVRTHSLTEVATAMEANIPVGRHRWRLRYYDNCFIARDAVTYLVKEGFARDRKAAVHLGKKIQRDLNLYHHVCEEHDFSDDHYFFRFTAKEQRFREAVAVELPLSQIAMKFERGVRVRSHTYRMKKYPRTFEGKQAVDYLVQSRLAGSRKAAVRIGKALVEEYRLFTNVTGDVEFADDQFLFRFVSEDQRNDHAAWRDNNSTLDGSSGTLSFNSQDDNQEKSVELARAEFVFSAEGLHERKLHEIADAFRTGVKLKNNRWRARVYPQTFVGSDAVTYLVNSSCVSSRKEAVEVGQRLQQELKLFYHVKKECLFKDDYVFYKFNDKALTWEDFSSRSASSMLSSSCNAESLLPLERIAEMMQNGVKTRDRRYHLRMYKDCFVGSEAVDFLVGANLADSRVGAVGLGRRLRREFNLFEHVVDVDKPFRDDYLFYRFLSKETQQSESQELFESMDVKRLIALAICFEKGVHVGENQIGLRVYSNSFYGSEAVDYVMGNFRFMVNSRVAAVHFAQRLTSEFNLLEHVTNEYGFKDCPKSLYFFTRPEQRSSGMFFERVPGRKNLKPGNSVSAFWESVVEVVGDIPRVSDFEIETDDMEWSHRLKEFENRCSRRESFDNSFLFSVDMVEQTLAGRIRNWASEFRKLDPRYQILSFFNQVAQEGVKGTGEGEQQDEFLCRRPLLWYLPNRASVFTVWRPTSLDAIRRMMCGEAVGKGLDIKGKSAKRGKLSSFVPFLQISENKDKTKVRTLSKDGVIRVFYSERFPRDIAVEKLESVAEEMIETTQMAKMILENDNCSESALKEAYESMLLEMTDPTIRIIDDYAPRRYGFQISERLFWEAYVVRQDITRDEGCQYCTGRPSQPAFQDLNLSSLRNGPVEGEPRAVVFQNADLDSPMNPFELLMAYEEHGSVLPVCSDFDSFLIGTRRVDFSTPLPPDQVEVMRWMVSQIETVLANHDGESGWTQLWIDVLRKATKEGFHPEIPRYGFGDAKSYAIMEQAIKSVQLSGAVRHGGEAFNYYFPQELDEEFLVISDDLPGTSLQWKYVDVNGLLEILDQKVEDGFAFPLNPKWILADGEGQWRKLYEKMLASKHPNIQNSMNAWFPPDSGIREAIDRIYTKYPWGFYGKAEC